MLTGGITAVREFDTRNTRVVMNFGAADGGHRLSEDLRGCLMRRRSWTDPCAVYPDGESTKTVNNANREQIRLDCGEQY